MFCSVIAPSFDKELTSVKIRNDIRPEFKTTGVTAFTTIAQDAPAANSIRNILRAIELPPGFTIDLYALVPDARHMAMAPQGTALFVGTKKEKVWVVMDRDGDNIGGEVKDFARSLTFDIPNGGGVFG